MVMEPSPQCVGREFVKQYYTMLNQAPNFLHRHVLFLFISLLCNGIPCQCREWQNWEQWLYLPCACMVRMQSRSVIYRAQITHDQMAYL